MRKNDERTVSATMKKMNILNLLVVLVVLVECVLPISAEAGFGSFMRNLQKNVDKGSSSRPASKPSAPGKPKSADEENVIQILRAMVEDRPERTNVEDEVGYGDTITAKMIQFYGGKLLDEKQYPGVWKYCNLIIQALGQKNIMRPKLSVDSTYVSHRIETANEEDKKLFSNIGWHVGIIDSDEVGAVSAPGGYVLVTSGLLKSCRCEAELAGVIAHEMAHISRSHGLYLMREQMKKRMPVAILGAITGDGGDFIGAAVGALDGYVGRLSYGRGQEFEADRYGAQIMYRTGYNPLALSEFISTLKSERSRAYRSHPSSRDRAKRLNAYIKKDLPGSEELPILQERYDREVRKKLLR